MKSVLLLCALTTACGVTRTSESPRTPVAGDDAWLVSNQTEVVSIVSEELPADWIHAVPAEELPAALGFMEKSSALLLEVDSVESFPSIPTAIAGSGDNIYLLRAYVDDDRGGDFAVFRKDAAVAVVYGHMGECGPLRRAAVIVRSRTRIDRVYGGCSGTK